jgi:hypothetical protein
MELIFKFLSTCDALRLQGTSNAKSNQIIYLIEMQRSQLHGEEQEPVSHRRQYSTNIV